MEPESLVAPAHHFHTFEFPGGVDLSESANLKFTSAAGILNSRQCQSLSCIHS